VTPESPSPSDLSRLGRAVADALPAVEPARLARQRARLVAAAPAAPRRVAPIALATGLGLAAAAGLVARLGARPTTRPPAALTAHIGPSPVTAGQWIAAAEAPVTLRFSDGSAVSLAPGSHARVESLDVHGARVLLERGRAVAAVRHGNHTRWVFSAGPYAVDVTGTSFALAWAPERSRFDLAMRDGSVTLRGPRCAEGILVRDRDEAHADLATGTLTVGPLRAEVALGPVPQEPIPHGPVPQEPIPTTPRPSPSHTRSATPRPIAPTERAAHAPTPAPFVAAPVAAPAAAADSASLLREADALRLANEPHRARTLLIEVRGRFRASPDAARAAFSLGTLTLDAFHSPAEAARWFELCVREAPSSPLANTARGRRVEALHATPDTAAARDAAEDYLLHDGDGAFAPLARAILAR